MPRRRKPAHLVLIHGRGRFSFDRPPPELLAARWVGRLEQALHRAGEPALSDSLSGITFLDYMSLLAPYSRAYRRRLEDDLTAVAERMADETRAARGEPEESETAREAEIADSSSEAGENDEPRHANPTLLCPDCTGRYAESPLGEPRRRLRHLGRRVTEPFGVEQIAWVFPDAVAYLANERLRADIHDLLAYRLPRKHTPVILIAHSLGSLVAADLWSEFEDQYRTRLFVTAGSPLGVPLVRRRLRPRTAEWVAGLPERLRWVNVLDPVDPVTLARELRPRPSTHGSPTSRSRTGDGSTPRTGTCRTSRSRGRCYARLDRGRRGRRAEGGPRVMSVPGRAGGLKLGRRFPAQRVRSAQRTQVRARCGVRSARMPAPASGLWCNQNRSRRGDSDADHAH